MKLDAQLILRDYDGEPLRYKPSPEKEMKDLELKDVVMPLLVAPKPNLPWEEHMQRDTLARKIWTAKAPIEISVEEAALIKSSLSQTYFSSIAVAQVIRALEGNHG